MTIAKPDNFILALKDKHLLLDCSVFIDASLHPMEFTQFFRELKENNVTLLTIKPLLLEFVRGAKSSQTYFNMLHHKGIHSYGVYSFKSETV
jgi:hypothetical protein